MKKKIFEGAAAAIITPFTEDNVDFEALKKVCDFEINGGIDAIVVCGTTGESATMTNEEHIAAIKCVVDHVAGRVPVIAGTGVNDTRHTVLLTKAAEEIGADAALVVSPYYNKTTPAGLVEHFSRVAESTKLPLILYNVPSRTGVNIGPDTIYKLSKLENINAIKECNLTQIPQVKRLCGDDINIYSGEDGFVTMALSAGGIGVISVVADIMPKIMSDMVHKYLDGKTKEAYELQLEVLDLVDALFCEVNPIPIKEAYEILGLDSGRVRLPLVKMAPQNREKLIKVLENHGLKKGTITL